MDAFPLLAFLTGSGKDAAGRTIEDVLGFTDEKLEARHDYIQWLFPLPTRSGAVPNAPILSDPEIAAIQDNAVAKHAICRALEKMTAFYRRNDHWLVFHDHNHLRITRIIRSAGLLVGPVEAEKFYQAIMARVSDGGRPVSQQSLRFWREACSPRQ